MVSTILLCFYHIHARFLIQMYYNVNAIVCKPAVVKGQSTNTNQRVLILQMLLLKLWG